MTEHDLELYRRLLREKDARIAALEEAIRFATYQDAKGGVYTSWRDDADLSERHPILGEVHDKRS